MADNVKVTHVADHETLARVAAALEAIANGQASPEFIDSTYAALLDDTNTTEIFKRWWPLSGAGSDTKEQRMDRWFRMLRNDKTYGVTFGSPDASSNTLGSYTDASAGESCGLATDTAQTPDTLDEHRAFWWIRCNAVEADEQGTLDIKAVEFENDFDRTGELAPVYTLQVAPYIKKTRTDTALTRQLRTMPGDGYHLWAEGRNPDGSARSYVAHATYAGGRDAAGYVTSGADKRPLIRLSYSAGRAEIKKGRQYQTGWGSHDSNWLLLMWQLRHASLGPSSQMEGCLSYNFQYTAAAAASGVKYVPLTQAQANNIIVGSAVSVGSGGDNADRNAATNFDKADCVRVTKKEAVTIGGTGYVGVYLDIPGTIDVDTATRISTMPWWSGTTDAVLGRADGSPRNNTNGQNACRCAGIEFGTGAYRIMYSELYNNVEGEIQVYACPQGKEADTLTADYKDTGLRLPAISAASWQYIKEMDDTYDTVHFPKTIGGGASSSTYLRDAFYHPQLASGLRVPWGFAHLNTGAFGGAACVAGTFSVGIAYWHGLSALSRRCWRGELPA